MNKIEEIIECVYRYEDIHNVCLTGIFDKLEQLRPELKTPQEELYIELGRIAEDDSWWSEDSRTKEDKPDFIRIDRSYSFEPEFIKRYKRAMGILTKLRNMEK